MNKTFTINISQIVFHIDEQAYDILSNYLNTIKSYFNNNESKDEILADIEARIAEIFSEKLNNNKQVINVADVNEMIAIMGNPEVFKNDDEYTSDNRNKHTQQGEGSIGETKRPRRIFRDKDDKVFGGVCSGIGAYFGIDPIWLRLIFAGSFFIFGTGFLFYIVLWMIIPEAKTTADKLEMRGEKVNINNIEKKLKEEMEDLKSRFSNNEGIKASGNSFREFVRNSVAVLEQLMIGFGRLLVNFIGVIVLFVGIILLIVLLSGIFGNGSIININNRGISSIDVNEFLLSIFNAPWQLTLSKFSLFLLVGIPILMIIYKALKLIFKTKVKNNWVGAIAAVLWIIGLATSIYLISDISDEFRHTNKVKETFSLHDTTINTLYLNLPDNFDWNTSDEDLDEDVRLNYRNNNWVFRLNNRKGLSSQVPTIDIQKSNTDSFQLVVTKIAKGRNKKDAMLNADALSYQYNIKDSIIVFNPYFELPSEPKWRAQRMKIVIKIPEGKSVFLSNKIRPLIYDIENVSNTYDGDMVNHKWTMRPEGLTCVDCGSINGFERKKDNNNDENE